MDKIKKMIKKLDGKTFSLSGAISKMEEIRKLYAKTIKKESEQIEMKFN